MVATVSKEHAGNLMCDRDKVIDMLCKLANAFADTDINKFNKIWYGD